MDGRDRNHTGTALWYASRATGVVTLVLLTAVVVLGMLVNRQGRLPGLPRFAVTGLHRNISLLSVVFLAIHVLTAIADPYVTIGLAADRDPVRLPVQAVLAGPGRAVARPDRGADPDQPGPGPDEPARLAQHPLARLRRAGRSRSGTASAAAPTCAAACMLGVLAGCVLAVCAAAAWRLSRAAREVPRARRAAATLTQMSPAAPSRPAAPGLADDQRTSR